MKKLAILISAVLSLAACKKENAVTYPQPEDIGSPQLQSGFVDMGLSVKWASDNLGARESCADGSYYCWGYSDPTTSAVKETEYKFISQYTGQYNKYTVGDELEDADDAVIASLGGNHRLPTYSEAKALVENCEWKYVVCHGKTGYTATSKLNGAVIFFPCQGYYADEGLINKDFSAHIWTREVSYEYKFLAYCVTASPLVTPCVGQMHRYLATSLRAVEY